ncbi:unnamed protein product [Linum tenue]|uniref:Uncharacterized protein n=1 Tax=Linum tenue TaxID=586396 RepID=A0AAV0P556_9ROSI|nr:unnamed protein product [Linum tenue]
MISSKYLNWHRFKERRFYMTNYLIRQLIVLCNYCEVVPSRENRS